MTQAGPVQSPSATAKNASSIAADHQLFVDLTATGTGDGRSWQNAFPKLQDALALARSLAPADSVEIWVAKGVYFPDVGAGLTNNDRNLSFQPAANVALYGGFAGGESLREQRDWLAHPTTLSGDIDGNDLVDADGVAQRVSDIRGNNSYHVVLLNRINGSVVLDGFTITSGQATGLGQVDSVLMRVGAGLSIRNSNAVVSNLRFQGNLALEASSGSGGGIYAESDSGRTDRLTLSNVEITANSARYGGGLDAYRTAVDASAVTFLDNDAEIGGAVHLNLTTDVKFRDSVFRGNSASVDGGAFYGFREYIALVNCELTGNTAANNGGAYYSDGTTLDIKIVMTNVVISGNRAGVTSGGIYREQPSYGRSNLWNTIIWNNEDSSGVGTASANHGGPGATRLTAAHSLIQGLNPSGAGNLDGTLATNNPLFKQSLDPSMAPSLGGDFHLQLNSPVIDKGDNQARINPFNPAAIPLEGNVLTDLDGTERILDGDGDTVATVDMGPYESTSFSIGGTVSGLLGEGLVLQNSGGDDLLISADGTFAFDTVVANFSRYAVTVATQPTAPQQVCTVTAGGGTVSGANVTDVQVTCTTATFTIGGTVSDLAGSGLVLQNNGGDDLPISGDGSFTFTTEIADQDSYAVTVMTQPGSPSQTCTVSNDNGTVSATHVSDVLVTCITDTYTVTPGAGSGGSLSPATPQIVASQQTIDFTITSDVGYTLADISGSCGGALSGNVFTTAPIEADCEVSATFAIATYTVTASASANGSITPSAQTIAHGAAASFTVLPDAHHHVATVTGDTCTPVQGSGDSWSAPDITSDCAVTATFAIDPPELVLTMDDGRTHARYGQVLTYIVTLDNQGNGPANTVSIAMTLPPQLDNESASWTCVGAGTGAACIAEGDGPLADSSVVIPAGRSLTWLVDVPVLADAEGDTAETTVTANDGSNEFNASDSNLLVILRDGFDVSSGESTQGDGWRVDLAQCPVDPRAEAIDDTFMRQIGVPPANAGAFDTLMVAYGSDGSGFRVERANVGEPSLIRLISIDRHGHEGSSAWAATADASLMVATAQGEAGRRVLLLEGAASPLSLELPVAIGNLRVRTPA
ncbi:hypothetical protein, partial [Dokdonella sp.]|uniref:hypothetical protein n=1 Tax=Dokdonella sp. TaxID=2291710 RepID=UPI003C5D8E63